MGKALAAPARLELLDLLAQGERGVDELAQESGYPIANTSQHLRILAACHLIAARRQGQHVVYRLADRSVGALLRALQATAERQLADVDRSVRNYLETNDKISPLALDEFLQLLGADALLLDVRPRLEYDQGHLPGAICLPLGEVETWASTLRHERPLIAYCRGPYCAYALQAVAQLRRRGLNAHRIELGVIEWQALGRPIEVTSL